MRNAKILVTERVDSIRNAEYKITCLRAHVDQALLEIHFSNAQNSLKSLHQEMKSIHVTHRHVGLTLNAQMESAHAYRNTTAIHIVNVDLNVC